MQYALLFYNPPHSAIPAAQRETAIAGMLAEMRGWLADLERAGVFRTTLRLAPVDAAVSLHQQGGEVIVSDGPFAETKEILGGLALLECADLDEALEQAARLPMAPWATIEVRPIMPADEWLETARRAGVELSDEDVGKLG
jgi:hypothetical protein